VRSMTKALLFPIKGGEIVKRLGELEYSEVEAVLDLPAEYNTASIHIKKSYDFFVSRNPDYENCVKEAVSALESLLKIMTGLEKGNMADLLGEYASKNQLHPALRKALSNLFGFASDHGGIRHGSSVSAEVSEETARLVLMICARSPSR
jgi:hypothetical protein